MPRATFIHGKPTKERYENPAEPMPHVANWFPWIGDAMEEHGYNVAIPAMPLPYHPVYKDWREVFESIPLAEDTILVGHSAGAEFLLRWLSEHRDATVAKLALVAPYRDEAGKYGDFSKYNLDLGLPHRVGKIVIFNSFDDDPPIQRQANRLASLMPLAKLVEFEDYGHFRIGHNMTGPEFPKLLDELLAP